MLSVKNLIDTYSLTADDITQILDTAQAFESVNNSRTIKKVPALRGRTIVNLFLEPSTRTKSSFELAEKRLSADSLSMGGSTSSVVKGESLADTIQTISAMNVEILSLKGKLHQIEQANAKPDVVALRKRIHALELENASMKNKLVGIQEGDKVSSENMEYIKRIRMLENFIWQLGFDPKTLRKRNS